MKRREFIAGLGGAAAWPLAIRAQQPTTVVGVLSSQGAESIIAVEPFLQGLKETGGFIEGQNIVIEYRWAENRIDRLPGLAADLVRRRVAAIAAFSAPATRAAKAATNTIPIVFAMGGDPVSLGFVASLNRPGGNVTGYANLQNLLVPKRLQLLRDLKPDAALIGFLTNPADPSSEADTHDLLAAAGAAQKVLVLSAGSDSELERAFESFVRQGAVGVIIGNNAFYNRRIERLAALAISHALPTISPNREYAVAGGLMSYGSDLGSAFRKAGNYVGLILKGAKPADLPVEQATKITLTLNLKTAKALGVEMPTALLSLADEVIE